MSTDERELRKALEDTQAALRNEREAAKELRHTNAALDERLRELKQREVELERELTQSKLQVAQAPPPPPIIVGGPTVPLPPRSPEEPDAKPTWWLYNGGFGLILVVLALKMLWEVYDTPWYQTPPDPAGALPWGIGGALILALSIAMGWRNLNSDRSRQSSGAWFFVGGIGAVCGLRAYELMQHGELLWTSICGAAALAFLVWSAFLAFRTFR